MTENSEDPAWQIVTLTCKSMEGEIKNEGTNLKVSSEYSNLMK